MHWIALSSLAVSSIVHLYILHGMFGFSWSISISDCLVTLSLVGLCLWTIMLLVRTYPTKVTLVTYSLVIAFLLSLVTVFFGRLLLKWWVSGTNDPDYVGWAYYVAWLNSTLLVRFLLVWLLCSWTSTTAALAKNVTELNNRFQNQTDAAELLRDAELFKLRHQLQPHFLYNSLNSINALVMISPDRAQEMVGKLSDFLRSSVKREAEDRLPIAEELLYIESYLAIESVRFGDRLNVTIGRFYADGASIPPFLLQPILENAIKFGLYSKTGRVDISVSIRSEPGMLVLAINNPYDTATQPARGTGFGLEGIGRRLYLLFARTDLLETTKDEKTFTTTLKIPQPNA